jgi:hypothetical protein
MMNTIHDEKDLLETGDVEAASQFATNIEIRALPDISKMNNPIVDSWKANVEDLRKGMLMTKKSSELFDRERKKEGDILLVPSNWDQLCERSMFFRAFYIACVLTRTEMVKSPDVSLNIIESNTKEWENFCKGLSISLDETSTDNMAYASTSRLEQARILAQRRRILTYCAALSIPIGLTRHGKWDLKVSNSIGDPLYEMVANALPSRQIGPKLARTFCNIFSSAQAALAQSVPVKPKSLVMSFEETWNAIANAVRTPSGKVKFTKSGSVKKYHPSKPRFNGMTREEITKSKKIFEPMYSETQRYRSMWKVISGNNILYKTAIADLQNLYRAQCASNSQIRNLAKSRLEGLNLRPNATNALFLNRKTQAEASENYNPIFDIDEIANIHDELYSRFRDCCLLDFLGDGRVQIRENTNSTFRTFTVQRA